MSLNVGELVGYLRLDMGDFETGMAKGTALADKLDGKNVDVNVDANTGAAEAKLAAVALSARKLADASSAAHIAQLRLSEAQGSGTAKASSLASAHQSVTKAERDLSDLMKSSTPEVIRAADAMKQLDDGNKKVTKSSHDANKEMDMGSRGMGAMVTAVLMLGSAIVPLAAGAAGLAVGFGAMGAAGVLAVVGIMAEMKAGTPLGLAYTGMLQTLKGDLTTLGHTAASGTLAPFQQAVADLQQRMPVLNSIVGEFSVITGKTAGTLTTGLVAAFIALAPLGRDAGVYILTLSQRFAAMMSGPGVVTFGDYVRSVFPQVMQAVESIVAAVFHLVAAIAPLGMGSLGILRMFTDLLNALPTEHLALLVQTASSVYLGFKLFGLLSGPLEKVSTQLQKVGLSAETAAAGVRTLTIAAGVIGAIIAVATLLYSAHADATRKNQQATNDYTDALRTSNGVIDENIRQMAFKSIQEVDGFRTGAQYGVTQRELVDAALNLGNAQEIVNAKLGVGVTALKDGKSYGEQYAAQGSDTAKKLAALGIVLDINSGALKTGIQNEKDWAAASATGTGATGVASAAQQALAARIGTTGAALAIATTAQQKTGDATANAAAKMYLEGDAAGLLKQALDLLNGKTISAAQAQNSFDSSLVNMGDHVNATGKKITFTTTSIKDMSSASVALRGQLLGQVTNLQNVAEANRGAGKSTDVVSGQMKTMRQQIIDNAVAHGVNRAAVTAFIDKLLTMPKSVPPIPLEVKKAAAEASLAAFDKSAAAATRNRAMAVRADIGQAMTAIQRLQDTIPKSRTVTLYVAAGASSAQALNYMNAINKRAGGGPVTAGQPYIVGERRPELFVPDQNGTIIPQVPAPAAKGGSGPAASGAKFNVEHMTVVGYNPDDAVQRFGHEIAWTMAGAT